VCSTKSNFKITNILRNDVEPLQSSHRRNYDDTFEVRCRSEYDGPFAALKYKLSRTRNLLLSFVIIIEFWSRGESLPVSGDLVKHVLASNEAVMVAHECSLEMTSHCLRTMLMWRRRVEVESKLP